MHIRLRLFLLLLGGAVLAFAQESSKKNLTFDDFISYRQPEAITPTWAPDGQSFFYEQDGALNLYQIAGHKSQEWFRPEALDKAAKPPLRPREFGWQNRRVSSSSYQWFPNSKNVLAAANGDLFIVHPKGNFEQLTKTDIAEEDPHLSPDGKNILYRWKANLYVLNLATRKTRQLTNSGTPTLLNGELDWVYPEELDLGTAVWWSPDSRSIAFFQFDVAHEFVYPQVDLTRERALSEPERYPQAGTPNAEVKLGVISLADGATQWMKPGSTANALLARVIWLPDSSQLAVERFNRIQDKLDLLFCDAKTGATHTVLHEQSKTWINVADNLFFLKSRAEFLWTSERSGFRHIYRYANNGELLGELTNGDWEIGAIAAIDEKRGRVYYTSSETSPLETQLYSIALEGKDQVRITREPGTHQVHMNEQGSYFVDAFSSLDKPEKTILEGTTEEKPALIRASQNEYSLLPEEILPVKTQDGTILYGRLIRPARFQAGTKYPLVVSVYGGPGVQAVRNRWYGPSWEQVLAHNGYVVWQLDNRGSKGRGLAFEAPLYRNLGKQEVADQRFGVEHLIAMGFVDPERVGIAGFSYGGYMTIRLLLFAPDVFKVGVAGAPVTDWHNYDTIYTERYMGLPDQNVAAYEASSNVKNAGRLQGKLLIIHNLEDDNVLFQNTMQMASALEHAGKPFLMQIFPQKTHAITGPYKKSFYQAMANFFDAHLKKPGV